MPETFASLFIIMSSGVYEMPLEEKRQRRVAKLPPDIPASMRLLTIEEVAACLNLGERSISRMVSAGEFPKPVKKGRWKMNQVEDYVAALPGRWKEKKPKGAEESGGG